jgi:DNA-binding winged helix-turn-helix (wHTH) protein
MPDLVTSKARFGPFTFDVRTGELLKAGTRIKVPDQSIEILRALLERPGELITREELRQRLWPDNTFVDFEHGLNAAVRRLREVLGDSAEAPRYIETLPRRGYRFVEAVVPTPAGPGAPGAIVGAEARRRRSHH